MYMHIIVTLMAGSCLAPAAATFSFLLSHGAVDLLLSRAKAHEVNRWDLGFRDKGLGIWDLGLGFRDMRFRV